MPQEIKNDKWRRCCNCHRGLKKNEQIVAVMRGKKIRHAFCDERCHRDKSADNGIG